MMKVTYRIVCVNGYMPYERLAEGKGVILRVKHGTPRASKLRDPRDLSECDWIIPNLRDPYGQAAAL